MIINTQKAAEINRNLLDWFRENKRELPFRKSRDVYKIWISEIMAQQTGMSTLLPYYERFIKRFPTVEELSKADLEEVLSLWEGLGYYSRAKNIKKTADIVAKTGFPDNYKALLKLPGIGPYTAGAIASICFNEKVAAVDGNVLRVISRIYASQLNISEQKTKNLIAEELKQTMPDEAGLYNESLMELGALICTAKNPLCLVCPVKNHCRAYREGLTDILPVKSKPQKKEEIFQEALIILNQEKKPLYQKRGNKGVLSGLYGFPLSPSQTINGMAAQKLALNYNTGPITYLGQSRHVFTHQIWTTDVYIAEATENTNMNLFSATPSSVPTAFKKMLALAK